MNIKIKDDDFEVEIKIDLIHDKIFEVIHAILNIFNDGVVFLNTIPQTQDEAESSYIIGNITNYFELMEYYCLLLSNKFDILVQLKTLSQVYNDYTVVIYEARFLNTNKTISMHSPKLRAKMFNMDYLL